MNNNYMENTDDEEENDMAAITKPNVFEVSVTKKDKEKINEARLTKSFVDECLEVAKKLQRGKTDK